MRERRDTYRILVEKPEGREPLGRPRSRWEDCIKTCLKGTGWDGVDWIDLAQDLDSWRAVVNIQYCEYSIWKIYKLCINI
jgi:hypothetical protein